MTKIFAHSRLASLLTVAMICGLAAGESRAQYWIYTVRPGDNLWNISEKYLVSMGYWRPLQELNEIDMPREIPPGSTLRLPVRWLKVQPAEVLVIDVRGRAEATDGLSGATAPLQPGAMLRASDEIRVTAEGSVTLQFADGSRFIVQSDTHLILDTVSAFGDTGMVDTRMRLLRGRLDARTAPSEGPGTRFEVWTPAAVSAVRGTDYRVAMEPERQVALTETLGGAVEVTAQDRTQRLPSGFGTVTETGQPPSPPVPLLPPPDVSGLPPVVQRVPILFEIPALADAVGYRLQIAPDPGFETLLFDQTYPRPQFTGPDLPDGTYALRVRGIDERGLEGRDAHLPFEIDARPEPPFLMTPDDEETIRTELPRFNWTDPQRAEAFHFQLAASADLDSPLIDLPAYDGTELTPDEALAPGSYVWRVATIDDAGEIGPFSDRQTFTVRPAPEGPELEEPALDEDTLVFRWREGLAGQRYQVQLARDPDFSDPLVDQVVDEARLEIPRPTPERYYLRVRTIDVDGYTGPFGQRQQLDVPPTSYWPLAIVPLVLLAILVL